MRITKRQLKRIIKEEKAKLLKEAQSTFDGHPSPVAGRTFSSQSGQDPTGLYVNLTDEQENALNDLDAAMAACVRAGCSAVDVMDTVQGYNLR